MTNFTEYEIALHFSGFQKDIETYKNVMKKLKRKKIDFDSHFAMAIRYLKENEDKYFEMMKAMFATEDVEEKEDLIKELSWMIYNRFGIQQKMFDYETEVTNK